jgi:aryl-alcohol dehydrogenase-like predicted oxidoreductase
LLRRRNEADLLSACARHCLMLLPYFPLASGLLTGKYRRGQGAPERSRLAAVPAERRESALSDRHFDVIEALDSFARVRGHTLLELAMSWLAGLTPTASVIAGATKPEQLRANVAAVGWSLTSQERAELDEISPPTVLVWGQAESG